MSSLAANINNTMRQAREPGTPVAGMVPNDEQESIIASALEVMDLAGTRVLVVGAGAGTGKTATSKMLEQVLPGRGQYTAFNSSLVNDGKRKFTKASCNTTHSLAFREVGKLYKHRLGGERVKSYQIARQLGIEPLTVSIKGAGTPDADGKPTDKQKVLSAEFLAGQVLGAIKRFCQSADQEVADNHFPTVAGIDAEGSRNNQGIVRDYLLPFARKAWEDICNVNGTMPFNHDNYVKIWSLGTGDDRPVIAADYILLDEAQDTAPVFLNILQQQTHAMLVMVGDDCQQIYEWRGACNAMKAFEGAPRHLLTQSYRFGQAIADVANAVLSTLEEKTDLVMRGLPSINSRVEEVPQPRCYLYRTNAGAVSRVMLAIAEKRRPHLIGGGDEVVKWMQAAIDLQAKRGTRHPELCCFDSWQEVVDYSKTEEGSDMKLMVKLVEQFGAAKIRDALKDMPKEEDADLVVCTAHKSKGREWHTVKLGQDFPTKNKMTDADARLLYVAATRAQLVLDITECPPFCGGMDGRGEDATFVPGIKITYTTQQPEVAEKVDTYDLFAGIPESPTAPVAASNPADAAIPAPPADVAATAPVGLANGKGYRCPECGKERTDGLQGSCKECQDKWPEEPAKKSKIKESVTQFTWTNFGGKWCVRGPADTKLDYKVTAHRKDGSTSQVTIRTVVKRFDDAWIYGL